MLKFDYNEFNKNNLWKILENFGNPSKLTICYFSTYSPNYTRTEVIMSLLNRLRIKNIFINEHKGTLKYLKALIRLLKEIKKSDVLFVAFRGQEILPLVKVIATIYKKPIVFDAFVSTYDTLCFDRKIFKPKSIIGRFLKGYDKFLCNISDVVLVDTKTHKEYFEKEFKAKNIDYLYVGCNRKIFKPIKVKKDTNKFLVFWYGSANPLQGVDVILKAAKILENNKDILFRLVGPIKKKYCGLIKELDIGDNVEFIDWIPYEKLPLEIARADVCLGGHFSNIDKAKRVIPGKVFQFVSMRKTVILGENKANKKLFREDNKKIIFVEMNSPNDLANKIFYLSK